jgi:Trypsin-like peptidase domain
MALSQVMAFSSGVSRAMRSTSVARAEGAHALIRGQNLADFEKNIFNFTDTRKDFNLRLASHPSSSVDAVAIPHVVGIASRMVRVAATYVNSFGRAIPLATTAGSGLLVGKHILTAAHVVEPRIIHSRQKLSLYEVFVGPGIHCPIPSVEELRDWFPARLDDHITSELNAVSCDVKTTGMDGTVWKHNGDTAVLRVRDEDAAFLGQRAGPLAIPTTKWFAPPDEARLREGETHYVLGYPSLPRAKGGAAKLWHGPQPVKAVQFDNIVSNYETVLLSRGTGLVASTGPSLQANATRMNGSPRMAALLPHMANALSGMSGGPVLNSSGLIVGMHVGGREKTGEYNTYVGVDHPVLSAALKMIQGSA